MISSRTPYYVIYQEYLDSHVILAGDLNTLSNSELVIRTGMTSIVNQPTVVKVIT